MTELRSKHDLSVDRACRLMSISKTAYYYQPKKRDDDAEIIAYLTSLAETHKRWGFDKMLLKAKLDKQPWNHKRLYRIYCELGLNLRVKPRKRLPRGEAKSLVYPLQYNLCWSIDFMSDVLMGGRKFRTLNVIDDFNREALLIAPGHTLPSCVVTQHLDVLALARGYPNSIRVDNGPEFVSGKFKQWARDHRIELKYIQPGKPAQNGFIERFNRTYRTEVLDTNLFNNLTEVSEITAAWLKTYNEVRPHESLAGLPPMEFARRHGSPLAIRAENSTFN